MCRGGPNWQILALQVLKNQVLSGGFFLYFISMWLEFLSVSVRCTQNSEKFRKKNSVHQRCSKTLHKPAHTMIIRSSCDHNAADHSNRVKILPCLRKTYPIKRLPSSHLVSGYSLVSYNGNTHVAIKL